MCERHRAHQVTGALNITVVHLQLYVALFSVKRVKFEIILMTFKFYIQWRIAGKKLTTGLYDFFNEKFSLSSRLPSIASTHKIFL